MADRYALVDANSIVVSVNLGIATVPGLVAYPCDDTVAIGWIRSQAGTFAPPAAAAPLVFAVAKIEFYRRCSDVEVGKIQALLADTGPKMTAIFDACVYFRSDAPEWQMLVDATTGLFGAERAAVLLAPSE